MRIIWTAATALVAVWLFAHLVTAAPEYTDGYLSFGELTVIVGAFLLALGCAIGAPVVVWRGYPERALAKAFASA